MADAVGSGKESARGGQPGTTGMRDKFRALLDFPKKFGAHLWKFGPKADAAGKVPYIVPYSRRPELPNTT